MDGFGIFCKRKAKYYLGNSIHPRGSVSITAAVLVLFLTANFRFNIQRSVYHQGSPNKKLFCDPINPPKDVKRLKIYFFSFAPLYRIFFLFCSIAALVTRGYFYCGCILYVIVGNEVLQTVLTAVRRSGK